MKRIKTFLFLLLTASLISAASSAGTLVVRVSAGIKLNPDIIRKALIEKDKRFETLDVEIVIYGYSTGTEVYTLAKDELQMQERMGEIKALVKFRNNQKVKKAVFLKGKGGDPDSLAKSLAEDALSSLGAYLN